MKEETIEPSPRYLKGFNHGYELAQHDSDLVDGLLLGNKESKNDYFKGLSEGMKEQKKEILVAKMGSKNINEKNKDRERDS